MRMTQIVLAAKAATASTDLLKLNVWLETAGVKGTVGIKGRQHSPCRQMIAFSCLIQQPGDQISEAAVCADRYRPDGKERVWSAGKGKSGERRFRVRVYW